MRGFPRHLNTRADWDLVHEMVLASELPADPLRAAYQGLLATQQHYVFDRALGETEEPDGPEPEYLVMAEQDERTGETRRLQFRRVDDPNARIRRLGFTVADVERRLGEIIDA